jgi:hypothetical protein
MYSNNNIKSNVGLPEHDYFSAWAGIQPGHKWSPWLNQLVASWLVAWISTDQYF